MGLYDRGYYREETESWNRGQRGLSGYRGWSMITWIIVINLAFYLLDAFSPKGVWLSTAMAVDAEVLVRPWLWWKFLTYGFAHAPLAEGNIMHIAGNMLTLFFLGKKVEAFYGSARFLRIYLLAIVVAGLGWCLITRLNSSPDYAYGASGAVSAIFAIFVFKFPRDELLVWGAFPVRAWILGLVFIGTDVISSLNPKSHIAGEAHLVGAAFGAACHYWNLQFHWLDWSRPAAILSGLFSRRANLRVHDPDSMSGGSDRLQEQADAILDKISREGADSVTRREQKILNRYSQQVRDRKK